MVTLTISRIDEQLLRVNIIPKRKADKESTADNALCTPLTVTTTAAELDQDLARQVVSFSHSYQRAAANLHVPTTTAKRRQAENRSLAARGKVQPRPRQPHSRCSKRPPEKRKAGRERTSRLVFPRLSSRANRKAERAQLTEQQRKAH
jgi:PRTRC genetic system protein E